MSAYRDRPEDLTALKADLRPRADDLLVELFGEPSARTSREWRWGRKHSVSYRVDRHVFYSFESEAGGSVLDAIMLAKGYDLLQAAEWARAWLGKAPAERRTYMPERPAACDVDEEAQVACDEARAIWRAGRSIDGTAAARYLQERSISSWPSETVRFVPARDVARIVTGLEKDGIRKPWSWWRWPALVFPLTDAAGEVHAVQLVALHDDGQAVKHWEHGGKLKIVRGPKSGAALRLAGDLAGPLVLAEGGETALSVWLATGYETWAMLGSIGQAPLDGVPVDRTIVVARDDDPSRSPARKALGGAIRRWQQVGRRVVVAQPSRLTKGDKSDFNDALQAEGVAAVRERIMAALQPMITPQGLSKEIATADLRSAISQTIGELLASKGAMPPPFKVTQATLGLGKSEHALRAIVDAISGGARVVYAVPQHKLAEELADRARRVARELGLTITVSVWQGRARPNPWSTGQAMCTDLAAVELAREARVSVPDTVCATCPNKAGCAYLEQTDRQADLWIVANSLLFTAMPANMRGADLLVIDEEIAFAGIDEAPRYVSLDELGGAFERGQRRTKGKRRKGGARFVTLDQTLAALTADLNAAIQPSHAALIEAARANPASALGEPLTKAVLADAGVTLDAARRARALNAERRIDVPHVAELTRDEVAAVLRQIAPSNQAAARAEALWGHVADFLDDDGAEHSGRLSIVDDQNGRSIRMRGVDRMGEGWAELPVLHLDATADLDLLRLRFPQAEMAATVLAAEPFVRAHQVVGRSFGKGSLQDDLPGMTEEQLRSARALADAVRRDILAKTAGRPGEWLIVGPKGLAEKWRGVMPDNFSVEWFGNVRGLDRYGRVAGVFIVGRWGMPPNTAGDLAAVLTGRSVDWLAGWYPSEAITIEASDGATRTVNADRHPDSTAEAVRKAKVVAELLQAIGRGRGVQRERDTPLDVVVYGETPLPLPLATLTDWSPPAFDTAMLGEVGAVLSSDGDAALALGQTRKSVERARARQAAAEKLPPCPKNRILLLGQGGSFGSAAYRRIGSRGPEASVVFDTARIRRIGKWLAAKLDVAITLTELHDPRRPYGGVRCPISGRWHFGLAPVSCGDVELPQDDWRAHEEQEDGHLHLVECTKEMKMKSNRDLEEDLTAVALAIQDSPEGWQELVEAGAALRGVPLETVDDMTAMMFQAADVALDVTVEPRRRDLCRQMSFSAMDTLCALACAGGQHLEATCLPN